MKRTLLLTLSALLLSAAVTAQEKTAQKNYTRGWYIGTQAGMPMAEGTFSSFGADKFRPGWSAGIHAGYRFTRVWSLEMTANWGQQFLAEQDCCFDRGYFLGTDWNRYHPDLIPGNMRYKGMYYKDLKSRTFVQRYGLQVNMNILGFFNRTKDSRWRLEVSPAVYGVGTSSDIVNKADGNLMKENISKWHLGYGGQAQVSYAVAQNMNIGIYGGFTHLTGKPMDGMPELHSTNFIVDAGVKFSFAFGGKKKAGKSTAAVVPAVVTPAVPTEQPKEEVKEVIADTVMVQPTEEVVVAEQPKDEVETRFPVIYFSFNSVWIEPSERTKVKEIADLMKANPDIRIRITGWGDETGGEEANKRVSLQRAEAVKRVLGQWLIPAERIETVGAGINHDAANNAEARKATIIEIL